MTVSKRKSVVVAKKDATPSKPRKPGLAGNGGLNKFVPSELDRQTVTMAAAIGMQRPRICKMVRFPDGISEPTLNRYFAEELALGADRANLAVAGNLFRMATSTTHPGAVASAIFWMKTRARWTQEGPMQVDLQAVTHASEKGSITRFTLKIGERDLSDDDAAD